MVLLFNHFVMELIQNPSDLPIVYLTMEEILSYRQTDDITIEGYSYEWEGEQVVHLHTHRVPHSFGTVGRVIFTKLDPNVSIDCENIASWVVYVSKSSTILYKCVDGKLIEQEYQMIPSKEDLYSRNKGILEIGILEKKHVGIIGLGSFGSQIAIELAKAGVGEFSLFDFDRVELHNLARHTCTTKDLGRLKTDAIEEAIKGKNPYANIHKYPIDILKNESLLKELIPSIDLVICATDNNQSRFSLSKILHENQTICIFGRAITRAEGGDVFIYRPGGPCYNCLVGNIGNVSEEITNETSARRDGTIAAYVSPEDANAMVQVGLSADIEPICNMMIKLSLMELSRGQQSGISSLEEELVYDYYMWANRRERKYANYHAMPGAGPMPTIMRWYGARIKKLENCSICSNNIALDEGEDIENLILRIIED